MNEFTKAELQHILKIMDHCYLDNYGQELGRKIQAKVDNYCEHDGEIGKDYPAEKCMKCGAYWE